MTDKTDGNHSTTFSCHTTVHYFSSSVFYLESQNARRKKTLRSSSWRSVLWSSIHRTECLFMCPNYSQPNNPNNRGSEKCSTQLSLLWFRVLTSYNTCDLWFACFAVFLCQISIVIMSLAWFMLFMVCKLHIGDHLLST